MEIRKMILNIQTGADNPVLRRKAKEVKKINSQIRELILNMKETLESDGNSIGLAAPQVGKSLRIIAISPELNEKSIILINPKIVKTSFRKIVLEEGCLSLPNISIPIKRHSKITVQALNEKGEPIKIKTEGLAARIIQHEIDHLEGILIIDSLLGTVPRHEGLSPDYLKTIFIGTSEFAVPVLEALVRCSLFAVQCVITAPDKPAPSPIKIATLQNGLPILQPEKISKAAAKISDLKPDLIITASYGQIIPKNILDIPKYGSINIHPSLLPKYRGPSPIQTTILNGDKNTGISVMLMDEKMDRGPIIAQKKVAIKKRENYQDLEKRLSLLSANFLLKILPRYIQGKINPKKQNNSKASYTKILSRQDGQIKPKQTAREIERMLRAFTPWPGVWTIIKKRRVKILKAKVVQGRLLLETVQPEGKKPMTAEEFFRGLR
ncbi:MAG: methionyl-tRNA formyltransferase [Candidatus Portnoybacteria bacterium]|nr:methionyl-tRNA formyltransferase [Candidatus Portnoybacteria bacterium]